MLNLGKPKKTDSTLMKAVPSGAPNQSKPEKRHKPNDKAELWVQGYSEERMFKGLQTIWSFRSKEGTWKYSVITLKN